MSHYRPSYERTGPASTGSFNELIANLVLAVFCLALSLLMIWAVAAIVAYVSIDLVAVKTGLLAAWGKLVVVTYAHSSSAVLFGEGLLLGAVAGSVLGVAHFLRRWNKHHHRWVVEALFSPEVVGAIRYGLVCVGLHVLIAVAAAWLVALFGAHVPWPSALGGHGSSLLITHGPLLADVAAFGSGGSGGGWPEGFAFYLVMFVFIACLLASISICVAMSGVSWLIMSAAESPYAISASGAAILRGGAFGLALSVAAVLVQLTLTRIWRERDEFPPKSLDRDKSKPPAGLEQDPDAIRAERVRTLKEEFNQGAWCLEAAFTGLLSGAATAVIYVVIIFSGAAIFGIDRAL